MPQESTDEFVMEEARSRIEPLAFDHPELVETVEGIKGYGSAGRRIVRKRAEVIGRIDVPLEQRGTTILAQYLIPEGIEYVWRGGTRLLRHRLTPARRAYPL